MASIWETDIPSPPEPKPEPVKRSKHRETLTPAQIAQGKRRLLDMVERAFLSLEEAMIAADHPTAIKAAQIVLDRAGFGPKTTVDVNTTVTDLSNLSREQLAERASTIAAMLRNQREAGVAVITAKEAVH